MGFSKIPAISSPPFARTSGRTVAFSDDGIYLAHCFGNGTKYLNVWKRTGDTFAKLADIATIPSGTNYPTSLAMSGDGLWLLLYTWDSDVGAAKIWIYKRIGDTFTYQQTITGVKAMELAISYDGTYFATCSKELTSNVYIYKRTTDTFALLTSFTGIRSYALSWSPDSEYLAVGYVGTPYINLWKRTADSFADTTATIDTAPTKMIQHISWSSDSQYVSCAYTATPWIYMLKRNADSFTKITQTFASDMTYIAQTIFSQNGDYLFVNTYSETPYLLCYKRSSDTFTKLPNPSSFPSAQFQWMDVAKGGNQYFALSITSYPYLTIYKNWRSAPIPMIM